jgi:hypothetical protein
MRNLYIALCVGIVLEEDLDLSSDRILNEMNIVAPIMTTLCEERNILSESLNITLSCYTSMTKI